MKKQLFGLTKTAAALLGAGLLFLGSCTNIIGPPREGEYTGNTGTVLVSFGNGIPGARTLLPASVSFELFKLTITPVAPTTGSTVPQDISSGSSASIALDPGTWNIHVDAYTDGSGANKAAEGDSGTFTVSANTTTPVNITLKAVTSAGTGTLSVDISAEADSIIYGGWLEIYNGQDFNSPVTFYDGSNNTTSASISSAGPGLDISLPAGQYRVAARISNGNNQWVYINEIAYIYNNLTTELVKVVGSADFIDITTISGTVSYKENNIDKSGYSLSVSTNQAGTGMSLGNTYISNSGAQPYSFQIPRPDKTVTLYFFIGQFYTGESITLSAGEISAAKNIAVDRSTITLSGTIGPVTVNGAPLDSIYITAHTSDYSTNIQGSISDNAWEIGGIPTGFTGTLTIEVRVSHNGSGYSKDVITWTSDSPTSGISLGDVAFITLSGTIGTVTVNGQLSVPNRVSAHTSDYSTFRDGSISGGAWEIIIPADFSGTLIIRVEESYINNRYSKDDVATWTSGSPTSGINLGDIAFITLSGTIGTVTINGNTPDNVSVYAHPSSDGPGFSGSINGSVWELIISADLSGTLTIGVSVSYNGSGGQKDITTWTSGEPTTGINLGNVVLKTLSGTIGTVMVNGAPPDDVYIIAHSTSDDSTYFHGSINGGVWEIIIPAGFTGTFSIDLGVNYNGSWSERNLTTWTSGEPTTGINLGNVNITTFAGPAWMLAV
jgi:hypothetical protein